MLALELQFYGSFLSFLSKSRRENCEVEKREAEKEGVGIITDARLLD